MSNFVSKTPIWNNFTCPDGVKSSHSVASNMYGKLHVIKGMLEFTWEDTQEKIIIDDKKPFIIESNRKHHVNLIWDVEFYIEFYQEEKQNDK